MSNPWVDDYDASKSDNFTTISAVEIIRCMDLVGFPEEEWETGIAICRRESAFKPGIIGTVNPRSPDYGLWQISGLWHEKMLNQYDWRDPLENTTMAKKLYDQAKNRHGEGMGWQPWHTFTSGNYRRYAEEAKAWVKEYKDLFYEEQVIEVNPDLPEEEIVPEPIVDLGPVAEETPEKTVEETPEETVEETSSEDPRHCHEEDLDDVADVDNDETVPLAPVEEHLVEEHIVAVPLPEAEEPVVEEYEEEEKTEEEVPEEAPVAEEEPYQPGPILPQPSAPVEEPKETPRKTGSKTMFTKKFALDTLERALKTFAQVAAASLALNEGLLQVDVAAVLSVAGLAAVLSVLTSVGSSARGDSDSASAVKLEEAPSK